MHVYKNLSRALLEAELLGMGDVDLFCFFITTKRFAGRNIVSITQELCFCEISFNRLMIYF